MLSPAKSARRSGGWKFWDDVSSRRGSSPSLTSVPSPSPGNPSPLRNSMPFGADNSTKQNGTKPKESSPLNSPADPNKVQAVRDVAPATPSERQSQAHLDLVDKHEAKVVAGTPSQNS